MKQDLVQSVQKVLSKTVEEHLAELRTVMAEEIEIDFSPFSKLEMSTNSCLEILAQINMGIRNNNLLIQSNGTVSFFSKASFQRKRSDSG